MNLHKQKGVALITALIITSIAVSLAATVMYRQQIQIRLSSNISHLEQAYLYAKGMEDWAGTILRRGYEKHPAYDSLEDDWATGGQLISLPITGGVMNGQLFDLQARINLNSLARPRPPEPPKPKKGEPVKPKKPDIAMITRNRITRLIQEIDPDETMGPAQNFAEIVKDWIDKDQINGNQIPEGDGSGSGAESPYYQSLEPAYLSADTLLVSPTELRLLKNMKKEIYAKLVEGKESFIATLPINVKTPINLNTASKEVLQSIGFDPGAAEDIIKERKITPFESIKNGFLNNILQQQGESVNKNDLDVKSSYFLLQGSVSINNAKLYINSILERKNGQISVIMRDFSNP
jgi:general secretion pathway protein K